MPDLNGPFVIVVGIILLLLIAAIIIAKQYKVASPTEAIIVTGRAKKSPRTTPNETPAGDADPALAEKRGTVEAQLTQKVVIGGSVFVIPLIQRFQRISLESQQVEVRVEQVPSLDGILLDVAGVVTVKVNGSAESVRAAAQRFGANHGKIAEQAKDNMSGTLRSIIGEMNVQDILNNRQAFANKVLESIGDVIEQQGLHLDSFQINDVNDRDNYIKDIGRPKAALNRQLAVIAESNAQREAEQRRLENERALSDSQKAVELRKAENQKAIDQAAAEAAAARPLEEERQKQIRIIEEQKVEEGNARLRELQLSTTVRKDADAELYRAERAAEAKERAAAAEAKAIELEGQAKAIADAASIRETGSAKAEALIATLKAYKENWTDAAAFDAQIKVLPEIATKIADGYGKIGNITMVTSDGTGKVTDDIAGGIASVVTVLKDTMGGGVGGLGSFLGSTGTKSVGAGPETSSEAPSGTKPGIIAKAANAVKGTHAE